MLLGRAELRDEIDSDRYHGGLLDPLGGALHPGRYCAGLACGRGPGRCAAGRGYRGRTECGDGAGTVTVDTSAGPLTAGEVLVATNGYTGAAFPSLRSRVVPVGSYVVATAPLGPQLAARLLPRGRVMSDSWNLLHYFRLRR